MIIYWMSVRVCRELCLISISNIRLLLVAVPSYYWYPPSHPSVLISSHFWLSHSSPSLRPASARKYCCSERRERRGEISEGLTWSQTGDWRVTTAAIIFWSRTDFSSQIYDESALLAATETFPLLALWDWLNTEELSLILTLLFRQLGYVFISE